jgi:hypothetical protein
MFMRNEFSDLDLNIRLKFKPEWKNNNSLTKGCRF